MNLNLGGQVYTVVNAIEKLTVADSFVVPQNKIGTGNGEAKLYVGNENAEVLGFFGARGFGIPCVLLRSDLLKYLDDTRTEYLMPEQPYNRREQLPNLWNERRQKVQSLPELIQFAVADQTQIDGPRVYVNSDQPEYKLLRELSLPNITYIAILKLADANGGLLYYFRLFADYFGEEQHPFEIAQEENEIEAGEKNNSEKEQLIKARIGQGEYRKGLLEQCPFCPITLISDDRLLIASHIKPWAKSTDFEKTDPLNGFMLTPMFDRLFDRGFLSFTNDKRSILSPFLSNMTYSKIGIADNKLFSHLPVAGREAYLEYHRDVILKR